MEVESVDPRNATGSKHAELDEDSKILLWELGRRIVRLRRSRNWSRDDLARRMRVSRERLGHWERGSHTPPLKELVGLSRELGATIDELVTGKVPVPQELNRREREEAARFFRELERWAKRLFEDREDEEE
jgi:transcriptional regulator with XRE-family HTH domain